MEYKVDIKNVLVQYGLPECTNYIVKEVDASELLCPERLDIAAKYLYLKMKDICPEYARNLYLEHIRVMTKGSYVEPYSKKNSQDAFVRNFNAVFEGMKGNGYDNDVSPIPVDRNLRIMDGAHRIAACLMLGLKVPIVILPMEAKDDIYNQDFFESFGMDQNFLDEIVRTYVSLCKQCVCINIWPSAKGHEEELNKIINREFNVVYKKEVAFNENGAFFYLAQIYQEYSWAQNSDEGFSGVYRKLMPCFPTFDPVRTIIAEVDDYSKLIPVKEEMRNLFNLDKHSLHITDNTAETIQMANIILSNNTISFLNKCNALQYKNTFKLLEEGKEKAEGQNICFTGSIVMALYGIREANDLDYITIADDDPESHNSLLSIYGCTKEQAVYQRNLQFNFFDLNFLTLDVIKTFKKNRGEGKDADDIKLIEMVLSSNGKSWKAEYFRKKRRLIANVQGAIIRAAHKTGTYELLRGIYKNIKKL